MSLSIKMPSNRSTKFVDFSKAMTFSIIFVVTTEAMWRRNAKSWTYENWFIYCCGMFYAWLLRRTHTPTSSKSKLHWPRSQLSLLLFMYVHQYWQVVSIPQILLPHRKSETILPMWLNQLSNRFSWATLNATMLKQSILIFSKTSKEICTE